MAFGKKHPMNSLSAELLSLVLHLKGEEMKEGMVFVDNNGVLYVVEKIDILHNVYGRCVAKAASGWFVRTEYLVIPMPPELKCVIKSNRDIEKGDQLLDSDGKLIRVSGRTLYKHHELICTVPNQVQVRLIDNDYLICAVPAYENDTTSNMSTSDYISNTMAAALAEVDSETKEVYVSNSDEYLAPLFAHLKLQNTYSKKIIAAYVMVALKTNKCGITEDNIKLVKEKICVGLMSIYELDTLCLAVSWPVDMLEVLCDYEPFLKEQISDAKFSLQSKYIWPFIRTHEVLPGIHMDNIRLHEND